MDLCLRILAVLCKKERQFDFSLLILLLNPLDSFTVDSLFYPFITQAYMDAHCLSDAVLGSGDTKMDRSCMFAITFKT